MRESELLGHIYARSADLQARFPQVLVGPGHDCGAITTPGSVLLKTDQLVSGRHYRDGTPIDLIARKAVARAVSDVAAAGGSPLAALAAATFPQGYPHANDLFDALSRWAAHFGCPLVGGDIASWPNPGAVLTVSIVGAPHAARGPVLRSGARPGDHIYVTGALGGSFDATTGLGRHLTFEPRLPEAHWLCDTLGGDLHAMMDLSDGLGRDAGRLAAASGVRIRIDAKLIPCSAGVTSWSRAASDGEDYELLFAAPPGIPGSCPLTGTPITQIGEILPGSGCVIDDGGREIDASQLGWEHG